MAPNWLTRSSSHPAAAAVGGENTKEAIEAFVDFFEAKDLNQALESFGKLCQSLNLVPGQFKDFFPKLKAALKDQVPFKYREIFNIIDMKASQKPYHGLLAENKRVLVAGAGPCGLRTAIEAQLLGAKVIVIERRDDFTRNNILKLWKFLIDDLKSLGAKKFFGKFCTGNINHVGIRTLQLMLAKVSLLLGIRIERNIQLLGIIEPDNDGHRWMAKTNPEETAISGYEFDFLAIATGRQVPIEGFDRHSLEAKLSIAITANFVNGGSKEEAEVKEISGISKQFDKDFFQAMEKEINIQLENIVYYRGETHYFVMTALRPSLIKRGVILEDREDREALLAPSNINKDKLHEFAVEACQFATAHFSSKLPTIEWALDAKGQPDCAIFDFTNRYSARNSCRIKVRKGHQLLMAIIGDSLLEPFWPEGTGCGRGFLSSTDAAWMFRQFAKETINPFEVLAERENIYRQLTQTTDGPSSSLKDNFKNFTIEPTTRYRNIPRTIDHERILQLYDSDAQDELDFIREPFINQVCYQPEKHRTMLQRFRRQVIKKTSISLPVRVLRAAHRFKKSARSRDQQQ